MEVSVPARTMKHTEDHNEPRAEPLGELSDPVRTLKHTEAGTVRGRLALLPQAASED